VQALETEIIEGVDHASDVALVGLADQRDLAHRRVDQRRHQNLRALAHRLPARLA
jgi:hypothetical protein